MPRIKTDMLEEGMVVAREKRLMDGMEVA